MRLHIPNYEGECYYYKTISCIDAPLAIASGYYNYDNYFYYCAYNSIHSIWKTNSGFLNKASFILDKLGLELNAIEIDTRESLFEEINNILVEGFPVFLCLDYFYMFYCDFNYLKRHGAHGIIVCGIDEQKSTITIMDCSHISFDSTFKCFTLTQDIFWDIWKKSHDYFIAKNSKEHEIIYITNKSEESINSPYLFLQDIAKNNYISKNDGIINDILLNSNFNILYSDLYIRAYVNSIKTVFDIIDKLITQEISFELSNHYSNVKKEYLYDRNKLFLKILKKYYKNEKIEEVDLISFSEKIHTNNTKLELLINELYIKLSNNEKLILEIGKNVELCNYAKNAIVSASSELASYGTSFSAERIINGKYDEFVTDMWASEDFPGQHWIMVDIGKLINVNKIIIIHDFRSPDLFLVDFIVQGSKDNNDWYNIDNIKDNTKSRTIHYCLNKEFRYFRILIDKPSRIDNMARIFGVECWGY